MQMQAAVKEHNFTMLDKRTYALLNDYAIGDDVLSELEGFFTIFSDKTRLKIVSALAISEMCVSDLSNVLKVNQTTLSHQLRLLKNLDAVVSRREGKVIFYSLKDELLSDVMLKGVEFLGF
ncbi:MAG: metalloregulator ArsR/SmtB family transcription factor [Candidatus Borkfalkiaceae bacterium]|nr:metalloregulator ArsR/SmtB family transcription factor [Christensenellaceae bacterium]